MSITVDSDLLPARSKVCPLCGAMRSGAEVEIAECYTCGRDTWEDVGIDQVPRGFQFLHPDYRKESR